MPTIKKLPSPRTAIRQFRDRDRRVEQPTPTDHLDEKIWTAAHARDDPQLAVREAREYADDVFIGLVLAAGPGVHRLNCSLPTEDGPLTAAEDVPIVVLNGSSTVALPTSGAEREVVELFALAHVTATPATVILRSRSLSDGAANGGYTVRGWRLVDGSSEPIDGAGMFAFCCSEASSGEPLPLDPNARYADAVPLLKPPRPG